MMKILKRIAGVAAAPMIATPAFADGLTLTVDGVRNANGSVIVLIFDKKRAFEQLKWRNAVQYADIPASVGSLSHNFPDLTAGPYAIFVFHDENGDQNLNYNDERFLEGVGASGATTEIPEPAFAEASVMPGDVTMRIFYGE